MVAIKICSIIRLQITRQSNQVYYNPITIAVWWSRQHYVRLYDQSWQLQLVSPYNVRPLASDSVVWWRIQRPQLCYYYHYSRAVGTHSEVMAAQGFGTLRSVLSGGVKQLQTHRRVSDKVEFRLASHAKTWTPIICNIDRMLPRSNGAYNWLPWRCCCCWRGSGNTRQPPRLCKVRPAWHSSRSSVMSGYPGHKVEINRNYKWPYKSPLSLQRHPLSPIDATAVDTPHWRFYHKMPLCIQFFCASSSSVIGYSPLTIEEDFIIWTCFAGREYT